VYHDQLYRWEKKPRHIDINEPSLQHVEIDNEDKRELYKQPQSYPPTKIFNVSMGNNPRVVISSCIIDVIDLSIYLSICLSIHLSASNHIT
jgi:hypothetical protein